MDWYGWLWNGSQWERVCGPFASLSDCSRALGRIGTERGIPGKQQVMTGGSQPRFVPTHGFAQAGRSGAKPARSSTTALEDL